MNAAPACSSREQRRLHSVLAYLEAAPGPELDELTGSAAKICQTPIAAVSLLGDDKQYLRSKVGLDFDETSRDLSFCQYTIQQDNPLVIPDSQLDKRVSQNPYVQSGLVRFYAGVPLI